MCHNKILQIKINQCFDFIPHIAYNEIMTEEKKRSRLGAVTSAVGIICNIILAGGKIAVGLIFGLVSVMADGFNNLSDCGSSVVSLVSFFISEKPADEKHPYGHRRFEYIAAMITGFLVLFLAVELFRSSIDKIITGEVSDPSIIVYIVLGVSVAVKSAMFVFYRVMAKKLNADALKAAATDSLCDCIATTAVIIGIIILQFTGFPADGWIGIAVALFIVWQGFKILFEAGSKLLGQAPDKELKNKIRQCVLGGEGVLGMHDLRVYSYGHGVYFATVHVEMDAATPAMQAHSVIDKIELQIKEELSVSLTAHLDPIDLQDSEARELEQKVRAAVEELNLALNVHDFRLVHGVKDKAIFDLEAPFSCKLKDEELCRAAENIVRGLGEYDVIVTVERQ